MTMEIKITILIHCFRIQNITKLPHPLRFYSTRSYWRVNFDGCRTQRILVHWVPQIHLWAGQIRCACQQTTTKIPYITWLIPMPSDSRIIAAQHTSHHRQPCSRRLWCKIRWKRACYPSTTNSHLPLWKSQTRVGSWVIQWPNTQLALWARLY